MAPCASGKKKRNARAMWLWVKQMYTIPKRRCPGEWKFNLRSPGGLIVTHTHVGHQAGRLNFFLVLDLSGDRFNGDHKYIRFTCEGEIQRPYLSSVGSSALFFLRCEPMPGRNFNDGLFFSDLFGVFVFGKSSSQITFSWCFGFNPFLEALQNPPPPLRANPQP